MKINNLLDADRADDADYIKRKTALSFCRAFLTALISAFSTYIGFTEVEKIYWHMVIGTCERHHGAFAYRR